MTYQEEGITGGHLADGYHSARASNLKRFSSHIKKLKKEKVALILMIRFVCPTYPNIIIISI